MQKYTDGDARLERPSLFPHRDVGRLAFSCRQGLALSTARFRGVLKPSNAYSPYGFSIASRADGRYRRQARRCCPKPNAWRMKFTACCARRLAPAPDSEPCASPHRRQLPRTGSPLDCRKCAQLEGIDIELGAETAHVDLLRREADIAIRFKRPQTPDLAVRQIATVRYHLCATPEYLAGRDPGKWEFIGYDESLAETPQQEWLKAFAAGRRFILSSNDLGVITSATRAGAGIATLPDYLATGLIVDGSDCPVQRKLWMVIHDDVRKSPSVRRTADLLAELLDRRSR